MRLLVTGGCGFVGSNFIRYVLQHYGPEMVSNVDSLTTGCLDNLEGVAEEYGERYEFLNADAGDAGKLEALMQKHQFFAVVHFAAESAGVEQTMNLLARAHRHGVRRFLLVSKDRADERLAAEETAALEAFRACREEVVIIRATDNYGPYQAPTAFIPQVIIHALQDQPILLAGGGTQTRDWLHVDDHCAAIFAAMLDGRAGATYRIGSGHVVRDIDLAERILGYLGKPRELIQAQALPEPAAPVAGESEHGEGFGTLAWKPRHSLDLALRGTIDWYVRNRAWWEKHPAR